jgi:hypothetical protein
MERQIDSAMKRGRAYWFVDGFVELGAGIFLLVLGGAVILRGYAGQGGFLTGLASTAVDIGILKMIALLAVVLVVWWVKDRFTYPRTGFVRGQRIPPAVFLILIRNLALAGILPLLGLIAGFLFLPPVRSVLIYLPAGLPAGIGILWGVLIVFAGEWMGLRRFRFLGLLILGVGIAIGVWQIQSGIPEISAQTLHANFLNPLPETLGDPLDEILTRTFTGVGLLTLVAGIELFLSGLVTFLKYRKENPVPYREEA